MPENSEENQPSSSPTPIFVQLLSEQDPNGEPRRIFGLGHRSRSDNVDMAEMPMQLPGDSRRSDWPSTRAIPLLAGPHGVVAITSGPALKDETMSFGPTTSDTLYEG